MKRKQFIPIIALLLTLSACIIIPTTYSKAPNTIRIGVVFWGEDQVENYQPLFEEIIEPDINAYVDKLPKMRFAPDLQFEFLLDHGHWDAEMHLQKVQYFASIGVDMIIGGYLSGQASAALPYMNENDMLLFSPSSTSPDLVIPEDVLYRLTPDDSLQGSVIAEMIYSKGIENIIVIQQNTTWHTQIYEAFWPAFEGKGGFVIDRLLYNPDHPNHIDVLADADSLASDVDDLGILFLSFTYKHDKILVELPPYTIYNIPWFGADSTVNNSEILECASEEAAHVKIYSTVCAPDYSSKYGEMTSRYEALTGDSLDGFAANSIDAAWIIAQAVLEAKPSLTKHFDATDVMKILPDVASRYYGYSGWCLLNEAGDRVNMDYEIWGYGYVNGDVEPIKYGFYDYETGEVTWDD